MLLRDSLHEFKRKVSGLVILDDFLEASLGRLVDQVVDGRELLLQGQHHRKGLASSEPLSRCLEEIFASNNNSTL